MITAIKYRFPGSAKAANPRGFTLLELVIVLAVLVALAGVVVPLISSLTDDASETATRTSLSSIRDAIVGASGYQSTVRFAADAGTDGAVGHSTGLPWPSPQDVANGRADHPQLAFLYLEPTGLRDFDPSTRIGWRGPYAEISSAGRYAVDTIDGFAANYGEDGDPAPLDGWGRTIVIQLPDVTTGVTEAELQAVRLVSAGQDGVIDTPANVLAPTLMQKNDDVVMYLRAQDPNP